MGELVEIIALVKEIPESHLGEALEKLREIKGKADLEEEKSESECPHCGSPNGVRNGHKHGKQEYLCRECAKSYVTTTKSAIEHSRSSATVWKQVIRDTVDGISLNRTAENLALSHATVFKMRHKILYAVERSLVENPAVLSGVCEADETYVLESEKGRKIPEGYHRKARKHGAVAAKRGNSDEYICVCASVTGEAKNVSLAVNRAAPAETVKTAWEYLNRQGAPKVSLLQEGIIRDALDRLLSMAALYDDLGSLLDTLAVSDAPGGVPLHREGVEIITIHASKGLEFEHVFVPALEEGLLPFTLYDPKPVPVERIAEEKRLLYVAMTRAKVGLYLSSAKKRLFQGRILENGRSRFLDALEMVVPFYQEQKQERKARPKDPQLDLF